MQTLYHHIHNVTGKKYLGQTTRDLNVYKGSSVEWLEHLEQYGDDYSTEILFESSDKEKFKEVCQHYSEKLDVVKNNEYFNKLPEHGGSLGGKANPNHKTGKFRGYICTQHNTGLGKLGDSMLEVVKCIKYLMKSADDNQLKEFKKSLKELLK